MNENEKTWRTVRIADKADREAVALALIRNGYTVKNVRKKSAKGNGYEYFVAYEEERK